jgi:hypothetical protein
LFVVESSRKRQRTEEFLLDELRSKAYFLDELEPLQIEYPEFQLDTLKEKENSGYPIVMTPGMHSFWEGHGEFPKYFFVRKEEVLFWKVVKALLPTCTKRRIVIVGSPGVGKSCFLMLVGLYMACIKKRKVLIIRRVKEGDVMNSMVYFDGQGSFARQTNLSFIELSYLRKAETLRGALVLVDGYTQSYVDQESNGLLPFNLLATSCQYDAKNDDPSHVIVLPAWQRDDLLKYAQLTDWVIDTGLRKTKNLKDPTWPKLVKEHYFYSGGSLREFQKDRNALKEGIHSDCSRVSNNQAYQLVFAFGGERSKDQVDRLRRHYITDRTNEQHYLSRVNWRVSVDSGYALKLLGRNMSMEKQLEHYKYAKSIGAGFWGTAYELLLHHSVHQAYAKKNPIVLNMREGSDYERIQICAPNVQCAGEDETSCYTFLANLPERAYWHPDYSFFPFVDAVAVCESFKSGNRQPETVLAYIQVTVRHEKTFNLDHLKKLNEVVDTNPKIAQMKRLYVVVVPDAGTCEIFSLHDAPDPSVFLTMVSSFDPNNLETQSLK